MDSEGPFASYVPRPPVDSESPKEEEDAPWLQVDQRVDASVLLQLFHLSSSNCLALGLELPFLIKVGHWHSM